MRNTVVRATIKVNEKPHISGTRRSLTPQSIELKFDTDDYVGSGTPHAKNGNSRPNTARVPFSPGDYLPVRKRRGGEFSAGKSLLSANISR